MHSFTTPAMLAAMVTVASSTPVEILGKRSFSIDQVAVPKKVVLHPAQQMMKTYAKFGKADAAPDSVKAAAAAAASGSVTATPEPNDEEYLCPVTVGGNTLNLDFDTGSSDLWVYSSLQSTSQTRGHSVYSVSSGTLKSGYSWKISYGDGSGASGKVYADKVVVGGVTATSQAVEAATSISSSFQADTDDDGLLGLAFSSINTVEPQQQTTFFDTVKSTLAQKLFTVDLRPGAPGAYGFGFIDSSRYSGAISYVAVDNSQGFWGFTPGGYGVGTTTTSGSISGSSIADTGTTLLYVPAAVVSAYYKKVSGSSNSKSAGGYIFPCGTSLPSFSVKIGSGTFTVPGTNINAGAADNNGNCFGGIQDSAGIGFNIFGDVFLKSVFAVFDQTQSSPRLGFAAKA